MDTLYNEIITAGHYKGKTYISCIDLFGNSFIDESVFTGFVRQIGQSINDKMKLLIWN